MLEGLQPRDRILYDLTVTSDPDSFELYREQLEKNDGVT
jgi:hypothetical protein